MPSGKVAVSEGAHIVGHAQLAVQHLVVMGEDVNRQEQPEQDIDQQERGAGQQQPKVDPTAACSQGQRQQHIGGRGHDHEIEHGVADHALPQLGPAAVAAVHQAQVQQRLAHRPSPGEPFADHEVPHDARRIAAEHPLRHRPGALVLRHGGGQFPHQNAQQHQHQRKIDQRREAAPRNAYLLALAVGARVHLLARRQDAHGQRRQRIAQQPAQGVGNQIVHIRQPVGPGIIAIEARKLGELKKQAQQEGEQQRFLPATAEVVAQIDPQRHKQGHVGGDLERVPVPQKAIPGGGLGQGHVRVFKQLRHLPQRNELHPGGGELIYRLNIGQRQNDQKIRAHEIQDKRIDDGRPNEQNGPVPSVLHQHIGQRERQRHKREQYQRGFDRLDVLAHGKPHISNLGSSALKRPYASVSRSHQASKAGSGRWQSGCA